MSFAACSDWCWGSRWDLRRDTDAFARWAPSRTRCSDAIRGGCAPGVGSRGRDRRRERIQLFTDLDLSRSIYTGARIEWGGAIVGGLLFGLGMALVGTCGFGTLLRLGGGDLEKALLTFLVIALTAMITWPHRSGAEFVARSLIALRDALCFSTVARPAWSNRRGRQHSFRS